MNPSQDAPGGGDNDSRDADFLAILFREAELPAAATSPATTERRFKPLFPKGFGGMGMYLF